MTPSHIARTAAVLLTLPLVYSESDDELAAEAARIRAEPPAQLNKTIGEIEQGYNPDSHATEGLPY